MKKGFTLIELLVVVLIIGILSAVALPQYQKTVLKSRTAEAWTNLSALRTAVQVYCMETNADPVDPNGLSIDVENSEYFSYHSSIYCSNNPTDGVSATYLKTPMFTLGFGKDGSRSCIGAGCAQIGFTEAGSGDQCTSGGSSCYYTK